MDDLQTISWSGDAFDRKPLADYLTQSLSGQSARMTKKGRGLTVSLDATWGAGKSFFVTHWIQDLTQLNHPAVYFDAWENDIGDEASVALMASVLEAMREWQQQKLPASKKLSKQASNLLDSSLKKLRKALLPASRILLKGILQKTLGVGLDELGGALSNSPKEFDWDQATKATGNVLDKLFEETLIEHQARKEELSSFRKALGEHLHLVKEHSDAKLPMFIFIDELDRCRPSYAIKLLEEVKHIFGIVDVVYVVSTNLQQLQNSVRSLYGIDFDGTGYLRRLFDREYVLPAPDNLKYSELLFEAEGPFAGDSIRTGLPRSSLYPKGFHSSWRVIIDAFGLDLRTQRQVAALAEEVAGALSALRPLHTLWLFFLCALFFKDRNILSQCANKSLPKSDLKSQCQHFFTSDIEIIVSVRAREHRRIAGDNKSLPLSSIVSEYYEYSKMDEADAYKRFEHSNVYEYPNSILHELMEPLGNQWNPSKPRRLPIADYAALVHSAGFVFQTRGISSQD